MAAQAPPADSRSPSAGTGPLFRRRLGAVSCRAALEPRRRFERMRRAGFKRGEELRQRDAERIHEPHHAGKRNIAPAPLDIGEVSAVHIRAPGEFLLRNSQALAVVFDVGSEASCERGVSMLLGF